MCAFRAMWGQGPRLARQEDWFMAGFVCRDFRLFAIINVAMLVLPTFTFAQSGSWGEPIAAPADPEPPPPVSEPAPKPPPEPPISWIAKSW